MTGRYLTETEGSGRAPARVRKGEEEIFFSKLRQHSMRASLVGMRCPFRERWRMDRKVGGRQSKREWRSKREKQWGRESGEETFQAVFSIQRHFDRAEPTLWQGVEPFWSLLSAAWGKQGARIDTSQGCRGVFFFFFHQFLSCFWQPAPNRQAGVLSFSAETVGPCTQALRRCS